VLIVSLVTFCIPPVNVPAGLPASLLPMLNNVDSIASSAASKPTPTVPANALRIIVEALTVIAVIMFLSAVSTNLLIVEAESIIGFVLPNILSTRAADSLSILRSVFSMRESTDLLCIVRAASLVVTLYIAANSAISSMLFCVKSAIKAS